jgi:hypothetical protein
MDRIQGLLMIAAAATQLERIHFAIEWCCRVSLRNCAVRDWLMRCICRTRSSMPSSAMKPVVNAECAYLGMASLHEREERRHGHGKINVCGTSGRSRDKKQPSSLVSILTAERGTWTHRHNFGCGPMAAMTQEYSAFIIVFPRPKIQKGAGINALGQVARVGKVFAIPLQTLQ